MVKFNRNYKLQIQMSKSDALLNEIINVTPPFTIEFSIDHADLNLDSHGSIRIFNLMKENRDKIRKDIAGIPGRKVSLNVGYGNQLSSIAKGNIMQAFSVREGTNWITEILFVEGLDGISLCRSNRNYRKGTPVKQIISDCMSDLKAYGINSTKVSQFPLEIQRGNTYSGNTVDIINELSGGGFSVFGDSAYCMNPNDYITGALTEISTQSGLIGTPVRNAEFITCEMILEPRLFMRQKIKLTSDTDKSFNGDYIVVALTHRGTISEAVDGGATTIIKLGKLSTFGSEVI